MGWSDKILAFFCLQSYIFMSEFSAEIRYLNRFLYTTMECQLKEPHLVQFEAKFS